ncbi:MAG: 50S ribosomal protein L25 [Myxococcota bacterium]
MAENELAVEVREGTGKGPARRLRASGRVPAVCYGRGAKSLGISLDPLALDQLLKGSTAGLNTLIALQVEGGGEYHGKPMLVKELQRDPVSRQILHADLYAVNLQEAIQVSVPIHLEGTPEGVKMGGILDQTLREVELECMPQAIPEELRLDVSELLVGQSLHVRDLSVPEGATLLSDLDLSVVTVATPAVEEEPVAEAVEGEPLAEGEEAPGAEKAEGEAGADSEKKEGGE